MNRIPLVSAVIAGLCASATGAPEPSARAAAASREIVAAYTAVFEHPPRQVPSSKIVDGPITGNGDIGVTVSGPPEAQRYWISKNDFWKSGPDFKQCGPSLIGGLDIRIDDLIDATYHVEQHLVDATLRSRFANPSAAVTIEARVAATDNVMILTLRTEQRALRVNLALWTKDGYGAETSSSNAGELCWVTRKFTAPNLLYPTAATLAMRCLESESPSFVLEPGKPVTLVAAVMTNHESNRYDTLVRDKVAAIDPAEVARLQAGHEAWWRAFWAKSWISIEDKLLEKYYYASHYIMACCSRNANFPPGLFGNWITVNRPSWAGDIHLNYNHQAPFWALYSSNRVELTDPYDAPLLEHLAAFREDARTYLNQRGAYASVGIGPMGLTSRFFDKKGMDATYGRKDPAKAYDALTGQPMFLGQKSNALFGAMNMILRYSYTYDVTYLEKVYPYLSAVAEFWEDYLRLEGERYVIHDDSFDEVGPWQGAGWDKGYGDFNPINSLGFLRVFFQAMIGYSDTLGRDRDRRDKWSHILAHLSELPVCEDQGRQRFRACEGGTGSAKDMIGLHWHMLHALVFPATNIGLGSEPRLLKMIRDDMAHWDDRIWLDHGNAFQSVFIAAARVGYAPEFLMAKAREKIAKHAYPNLWIAADGGGIETCSGIPGMINEMMLQSHDGLIRVFPAFPANQQASFYRLRTFGAFLVSSAIRNGKVQYVVIESDKGRDCRILNPWPDKPVIVHRTEGGIQRVTRAEMVLETAPGERLLLWPDGGAVANPQLYE
jgi:hypothetical protein